MTQPTQTIAVVEDDQVLRDALSAILLASPHWRLRGTYPSAEAALPALRAAPPDVVLMDIQLPGMSGIECVAALKQTHPAVQVLMVTVYDNNDRIFQALAAGADGYLLKRDAPGRLLDALADLRTGGSPMSGSIARKVVQFFQQAPPPANQDHNLTPRERQILERLVQGCLYKEIADQLDIGVETVRTHLHNIYRKLQVRTRTEAVVKFLGHRPRD
jgi:DNA-binding NarL/FixJ family response regulator